MHLLLFGANGLVGTAIRRESEKRGVTIDAITRDRCDLAEPGAAAALIADADTCSAVVNAAAYTNVDGAESEPELAQAVNARAPGEMAEACANRDIPFLHFSTDCVFDGMADRPYREDDPTRPVSVYGQTKLAGERAVRQAGGRWAVVRVSWVFGAHGTNFPQIMLRLAREHGRVRVVGDQFAKPTPARGAAALALDMSVDLASSPDRAGLYHYAGDVAVSRAEFAREIFRTAGMDVTVEPIPTSEFPTPATRPLWAVLDTAKIETVFGIAAPNWRAELEHVIAAL